MFYTILNITIGLTYCHFTKDILRYAAYINIANKINVSMAKKLKITCDYIEYNIETSKDLTILELALERLTQVLEAPRKFDMNDVQDFATLRALYEYAMEHYHAGKLNDASALFEVIGGIVDDEKFSKAMKIHTKATQNKIDLDTFLDEYADMEMVQKNGNFYIGDWTKKAQELLKSSKEEN
jgi:hypothetical protein